MESVKIALIGAGNWGKNHAKTLAKLGVLNAVCDNEENLLRKLKKNIPQKFNCFQDYTKMLASDAKAIVIATPAHTHFDIAQQALQADKDVFIEKPMTLKSSNAIKLIKLAEKKRKILMIGHLLLYQPIIQEIKKQIELGTIGQLYSLHQRRAKLGRARAVEDIVWSFAVHDLAVMLFLASNKPEKITFSKHCGLQKNIADNAYIHLKFPQNVTANIHVSWLWPQVERRLTIIGSKAMLVYDELTQKLTLHQKFIDKKLQNHDEGEQIILKGASEPLTLELNHFIDCIKTRKNPISDGYNGLEVVKIMEKLA